MNRTIRTVISAVCAGAAAVAWSGDPQLYRVSASGESGIDLVSLGDGYYQDRFSVANKTLCVTGAVTHAAIPDGSYFGLIGGGSSTRLNLWETGLFSNNTLNTPIRLEGTGGIFDFYEDTLTLGRDWAKWIAWDADKKTILRVKNITVTDTSGEPFTFEPEGVMRYGGVATGTRAAARIGMDGGRVTALFRNFFGSGGTSDKTANHDNRYSNYYIGGATASGKAPGYADVSYLLTDNQTDSDLGVIYFGYNVLAANSLQTAQGLTNILRLACGQVRILNMVRYGPESALVRFEREGAWIQIPGWHGEVG